MQATHSGAPDGVPHRAARCTARHLPWAVAASSPGSSPGNQQAPPGCMQAPMHLTPHHMRRRPTPGNQQAPPGYPAGYPGGAPTTSAGAPAAGAGWDAPTDGKQQGGWGEAPPGKQQPPAPYGQAGYPGAGAPPPFAGGAGGGMPMPVPPMRPVDPESLQMESDMAFATVGMR